MTIHCITTFARSICLEGQGLLRPAVTQPIVTIVTVVIILYLRRDIAGSVAPQLAVNTPAAVE